MREADDDVVIKRALRVYRTELMRAVGLLADDPSADENMLDDRLIELGTVRRLINGMGKI